MSPEHPKGDNHTPGGSVVLMVGRGDRFLSGVRYITAMPTSAMAQWSPGSSRARAVYTAVLVPPCDHAALADGIRSALPLIGTVHADQYSWAHAAERYAVLSGRVAGWGGGLSPRARALDGNLARGIA